MKPKILSNLSKKNQSNKQEVKKESKQERIMLKNNIISIKKLSENKRHDSNAIKSNMNLLSFHFQF